MTTDADRLRADLKAALTTALKARDRDVVAALRSVLGAIDNAEAVDAPERTASGDSPIAGAVSGLGATEAARRVLSLDDLTALVGAEVADLRANAEQYDSLGRSERAAALRSGADAIEAVVRMS